MCASQLDENLTAANVGVCLTDFEGVVLCQNAFATLTCAPCLQNDVCRFAQFQACRSLDLKRASAIGAYHFMNECVGDDRYSLHIVNTGKVLVRTMYRLTDKYTSEMRQFEQYPLTNAQKRVLKRLIERATTGAIAREMSVSEDTIRSHIKAIYRKVSPASRRILKEIRLEKSRDHE